MQSIRLALAAGLLLVVPARVLAQTCEAPASPPVERHLRQLYLDLLGRPPTIDEYRAAQAKGSVSEADVRELMTREDFYDRMRGYHRALFRANISASVYNNGDARLSGTGTAPRPYSIGGNPTVGLRGRNGTLCDGNILQTDCNAFQEDPHSEPATKTCFDANNVPLPVSYDYDPGFYACTRLDATDATITSCDVAVTKGVLAPELLYFCDMRRDGANVLHPNTCLPDPAKPNTAALTQRVLEAGTGRVVSFVNPTAGSSLPQLDRCTLTLPLRNGVKGSYGIQRGCIQREGYVMAPAPFWETARTTVAMCAIEAQTRAVNPATLESCETNRFASDRSCGCGVGSRRCESGDNAVHNARIAAFNAEPELIADSVLRRDEPYFNILTTRRSFANGPISSLYRDAQGFTVFALSPPVDVAVVPNVPYTDLTTWSEYLRGPQHSGILTTPAYLLRFPTQRARVSEFYEAFLCKTFVPAPNARLPSADDSCNRENNLAKRCGCNYCHATIEPTGAHWGRYGERAATYLDPMAFPRLDPRCRDCALNGDANCGGECANYVMQAYDGDGAESLGMLKTYLYRTASEEANIEGGPRLLVERMMQTGDLERCAVRRVWKEFLGRPMSQQEEDLYLEDLVQGFIQQNRSMKSLLQRVLSTDAYRRID